MSKSPDELMAMPFGGATVAENLTHAVETGALVEDDNGVLSRAEIPRDTNWARVERGKPLGCSFLMHFLFAHAYARSAVPYGCRACYKVKVAPRTIRELVGAWGIGKRIDCRSKWGVDLDNKYSQNVYAGYFYTSGLEGARALYRVVRSLIDGDPKLGPNVPMSIKRGCSDYEAALGPSDQYEFAPELEELEAYLRTRYRDKKAADLPPVPLAHWIEVAHRIGDDTYLDFTGGRRPYPTMLTYDPNGSENPAKAKAVTSG
jgi:hypothetical protein